MSKKHKANIRIRCDYCNKLFELNNDNTYEVDGIIMHYCLYCGEEQLGSHKSNYDK